MTYSREKGVCWLHTHRELGEVLRRLGEKSGGEALAAVEGDAARKEARDGPAEERDNQNKGIEVEGHTCLFACIAYAIHRTFSRVESTICIKNTKLYREKT
jgi:hypothetical protein